jgi:hypothetical protein
MEVAVAAIPHAALVAAGAALGPPERPDLPERIAAVHVHLGPARVQLTRLERDAGTGRDVREQPAVAIEGVLSGIRTTPGRLVSGVSIPISRTV